MSLPTSLPIWQLPSGMILWCETPELADDGYVMTDRIARVLSIGPDKKLHVDPVSAILPWHPHRLLVPLDCVRMECTDDRLSALIRDDLKLVRPA